MFQAKTGKNLIYVIGMLFFLAAGICFLRPETTLAEEKIRVKLNVEAQSVVKGTTFDIRVYNLADNQSVTFKSSQPGIASVNSMGIVTAKSIGTTVITVAVKEGFKTVETLQCNITVGPPAVSIKFSLPEYVLVEGQKATLERIILPMNTVEAPKFSSYDKDIATVSAGGRVTAKSAGSTYIFAQLNNGKFAFCKVNVVPPTEDAAVVTTEETDEADEEEDSDYQITEEILKELIANDPEMQEMFLELQKISDPKYIRENRFLIPVGTPADSD